MKTLISAVKMVCRILFLCSVPFTERHQARGNSKTSFFPLQLTTSCPNAKQLLMVKRDYCLGHKTIWLKDFQWEGVPLCTWLLRRKRLDCYSLWNLQEFGDATQRIALPATVFRTKFQIPFIWYSGQTFFDLELLGVRVGYNTSSFRGRTKGKRRMFVAKLCRFKLCTGWLSVSVFLCKRMPTGSLLEPFGGKWKCVN